MRMETFLGMRKEQDLNRSPQPSQVLNEESERKVSWVPTYTAMSTCESESCIRLYHSILVYICIHKLIIGLLQRSNDTVATVDYFSIEYGRRLIKWMDLIWRV